MSDLVSTSQAMVTTKSLRKLFPARTSLHSVLYRRKQEYVHAVDGIDLELARGESLCLVGESGSGKTTTGKLTLGIMAPTSGEVYIDGLNIHSLKKKDLIAMRRRIQMVYQDPYNSVDPRWKTHDIVAEPLVIHKLAKNRVEREKKIVEALEEVGLKPAEDFLKKRPYQLSGGQRQRVTIARSLILEPEFVVADEPVSMIDVSARIGILNLLIDLKERHHLTYLFITHDLTQAKYIGDRLVVMYLGKIMEKGPIVDVIEKHKHPYTKALISNVPTADQKAESRRIYLKGETPSPIHIPAGCRFHPRCPRAFDRCREEEPELVEVESKLYVSCHLYT